MTSRIRIGDVDEHGALAFDLADLLALLGDPARESLWKCYLGECIAAEGARPHLYDAFNVPERVPGRSMLALSAEIRRVVEGVFEAFRPGEREAWIKLEPVGDSHWEVSAPDPVALQPFVARFRRVEPVEPGGS